MDQRQIDEVLERNNIIDVIGSYFPLKKTGSNFKARCPFHDEKTASFVVSEKKQIFKCFGCGKGGNAIHFVQEYEKISFFEALKKLAERVGIALQQTRVNTAKRSRRDLIHSIYKLAGSFFQDNLRQHGDFAKQYLVNRKISESTIEKFQIGYALDSYAGLRNFLLKNSINEKIFPASGLFTANGRDLFRQRLMFPIHDHTGNIIAFGGRVLMEDQGGGKYVNSPTTEIYTKGNQLYGFFITKYDVSKKDYVLICEGYTDFIRLFEAGFTNSAASLGTSLTDSQINLINRYSRNIYMLYDGDKAGRKAAVRAAGNIIRNGSNAKIIALPDDEDPDSFLLKNNPEELEKLISKASTLPNFLFEDKSLGLDNKSKLNELIEILNDMNDEISVELFIREISETFRISEHAINSRIRKQRIKTKKVETGKTVISFGEERDLLCKILDDKLSYKKVAQEIDLTYFFTDVYKNIFDVISMHISSIEQISNLIDKVEDENLKKIITELMMADAPEASMDDIINNLKLRKYQYELKNINERISQDPKDMELFSQKKELKQKMLLLDKKIVKKTLY